MEFENSFDVPAPIDEVYAALLDVQRVAPCVPGAEVLEQTGDDAYKVAIKVKVGPMSMKYTGDVEIVEKDEAAHRAVMRAKAREARGQGTVNSNVEMRLTGANGRTQGTISTDVQLSGRVASMGRGIIQDVSAKIVDQFAANLAEMLAGPPAGREPLAAAQPATEAPAGAAAPGATASPAAAAAPPAGAGAGAPGAAAPPRTAESAELSAASVAGAVVAGRLREPKGMAAALGLAALIGFLLGRRRR
jgi:carbon monoxide dehydrogenase subunit G